MPINVNQKGSVYFYIDLISSRNKDYNLSDVRDLLELFSKYINKKIGRSLKTPFTIKDGDAITGGSDYFDHTLDIYQICLEFYFSKDLKVFKKNRNFNEDINFYFGVGFGTIDTDQNLDSDINQINGSSFINAKEASEKSKEITKRGKLTRKKDLENFSDYFFNTSPFKFYSISSEKESYSNAINGLFYLCYEDLIKNDQQLKLFSLMDSSLNLENYKIGKELGYEANYESAEDRAKISSKISVLVNKSNYYLYKKVKRDIKVLLDTIEF